MVFSHIEDFLEIKGETAGNYYIIGLSEVNVLL